MLLQGEIMNFNGITISSGGIYISSGSGSSEKTNYGNETVSNINVSSSLRLNGTTVNGKVNAGGSITATNATVEKMNAGGSTTITDTTCRGTVNTGGSITSTHSIAEALSAGGSVTVVSSKILNKVSAGGSVTANRCEQLGRVSAGGSVDISECPDVNSVSASNHVTLQQSKVQGDVSSGSEVTIANSMIGGTLSCCSNRLVIEESTIDTIDLRCSGGMSIRSGGISFGGGNFSNVVVSGGSFSMSGGRIMIGSGTDTSNVFINGVPLSQLQAQKSSGSEKKESGPKQVLELRNCTVKNIIFEGGNGEVILSGNSELAGSITGGKVKD